MTNNIQSSSNSIEIGSKVIPGNRLGSTSEISAGEGTYIRGLYVHSSIVGTFQLDEDGDANNTTLKARVIREGDKPIATYSKVLSIGQIVLGKVTRVGTHQVWLDLVAVAPSSNNTTSTQTKPFMIKYEGMIRKENVQTGLLEDIKIYNCFRPGDVVLSKILSLGDSRRYYLTTCDTHLGVVRAICATSGFPMVPVSWNEMECSVSKVRELRKCAKQLEGEIADCMDTS